MGPRLVSAVARDGAAVAMARAACGAEEETAVAARGTAMGAPREGGRRA